jgi:hypothetical protein
MLDEGDLPADAASHLQNDVNHHESTHGMNCNSNSTLDGDIIDGVADAQHHSNFQISDHCTFDNYYHDHCEGFHNSSHYDQSVCFGLCDGGVWQMEHPSSYWLDATHSHAYNNGDMLGFSSCQFT